jgi:hypothetical protein
MACPPWLALDQVKGVAKYTLKLMENFEQRRMRAHLHRIAAATGASSNTKGVTIYF